MSKTVGDFVIQRLHAWGVRHIFGYPGDGINGVFGALNRAEGKIQFIQARHEEMAAFMASAYAKFSGNLGVCIATSGPGASHLTTGLYDAQMDHQPVLAIVGQQARNALGGQYQQELDLSSMFKDVASEFLPKGGKARGVQIDIDASMLSIRFPMEVSLVGDAAETLRALLPRLDQKPTGEWRRAIEGNISDWWKILEDRARQPARPVNPQRVTWELSPRLPERAVITSDSGSC